MYASSYYEEIENWNLINKFDRVYIINFDVFVINCHDYEYLIREYIPVNEFLKTDA